MTALTTDVPFIWNSFANHFLYVAEWMHVSSGWWRAQDTVCWLPCFGSCFRRIFCCSVAFLQTGCQPFCILLHGSGRAKCHWVRISCNGWMGQPKPLVESLVPWSPSDLVQRYNNCFSESNLPLTFFYGIKELISWDHLSTLIAAGQDVSIVSSQALLADESRPSLSHSCFFWLLLLWGTHLCSNGNEL